MTPLACKTRLHFSPLVSPTSTKADLLLRCSLWNSHSLCPSGGLGSSLPLCLCWLQRFPLFLSGGGGGRRDSWCCSLCLASAFSFRSWLQSHLPREALENSCNHFFYHAIPQSSGSFPSAHLSVSPLDYTFVLSYRLWPPQKHKSQSVYFYPNPCEPS